MSLLSNQLGIDVKTELLSDESSQQQMQEIMKKSMLELASQLNDIGQSS